MPKTKQRSHVEVIRPRIINIFIDLEEIVTKFIPPWYDKTGRCRNKHVRRKNPWPSTHLKAQLSKINLTEYRFSWQQHGMTS
jgi:hypothetical protein